MPVLLGQADIEGVVTIVAQRHLAFNPGGAVRVIVGQSKHADLAIQPAPFKDQIVEADIGNRDFFLHQGCVDLQRARSRVLQPGVEAAESAGRQCLPFDPSRPGVIEPLVRAPKIDRRNLPDHLYPGMATNLPASSNSAEIRFKCSQKSLVIWKSLP